MKLKLGAREYDISFVDKNELLENNDAYGCIDYINSKIIIKNVDKQFMNENLVHEVLHALFEQSRIETICKNDDIEKIVSMLTPQLHQLIKENIDIVTLIQST